MVRTCSLCPKLSFSPSPDRRPRARGSPALASAALTVSELLEALYRGDDERIAGLLADRPRLDVFEAAALGQTDRLRELLDDEPALANAFGDDGFQPLPLACFFGHVDAARLLLQRGADPNTLSRNEHIRTNALHAAAASENKSRETSY